MKHNDCDRLRVDISVKLEVAIHGDQNVEMRLSGTQHGVIGCALSRSLGTVLTS